MVVQILILALLLLVVPAVVGSLAAGVNNSLPFRWVSGQFFLWAGFQVACVPMVLTGRKFHALLILFSCFMAAMVLLGVAVEIRRRVKPVFKLKVYDDGQKREGILFWFLFWGLLAFQLIQAVRMAYADGDDAYYVAVSAATESSDTMYQVLPYTGFGTELDIRHCLAPFPIWIAYLAKVSGMRTAMTAHVVLPVVLIAMAYAVFYLIGAKLFPKKDGKLPLFLVFVQLLVLFGNYSIQTVENFLIARSRQGKAALGSIVIPFVLFLLLLLCEKLQRQKKPSPMLYLLMAAAAIAGCLCTAMAALLMCVLIGVTGMTVAVVYERYRTLLPLAFVCMPCVCFALLYLILG